VSGRRPSEDVEHLARLVTNDTVRCLFDKCASHPMRWVGFEELKAAVGRDFGQMRADLAGLTRLIRREFADNRGWPVQVDRMRDSDGKTHVVYRMTDEVAWWWENS
jgi:hypothetical protein